MTRARTLLAALAVLAGTALRAAPAAAFLGLGEGHRAALLWIPAGDFDDWERLDALLAGDGQLKLTVAVWPEMVTPQAETILNRRMAEGRVEVALRLTGDPILPLVAGHPEAPRPEDAVERLAAAREQYRLLFSTWPAGFVPGGGAVSPELFPALKALGFSWAAAGPYAPSTAPWSAAGGTVLVPARAPDTYGAELTTFDVALPDFPAPDVYALDEENALVPPGSTLRLLEGAGRRSARGWWTVSQAVAARRELRAARSGAEWPTWSDGFALWNGRRAARRAWELYGKAAAELSDYQNSGQADLKALESATSALHEAQAARWYRLAGTGDEKADRGLRERLRAVYTRARRPAPEDLLLPVEGDDAPRGPAYTGVRVNQGQTWLALENPAASQSKAPEGALPLADGTPPAQLWKPKSLRVDWGPLGLMFTWRMAKLGGEPAAAGASAPELGRLRLETYIDLNRVVGAGSIALLSRKSAYIQARDAWEYALEVSAEGAALYRSSPLGAPVEAAKLAVETDAAQGEVRVRVASSLLRGSPPRWGFVVLAADGASGDILGLIAPLSQQKAFLAGKGRLRLSALRAD